MNKKAFGSKVKGSGSIRKHRFNHVNEFKTSINTSLVNVIYIIENKVLFNLNVWPQTCSCNLIFCCVKCKLPEVKYCHKTLEQHKITMPKSMQYAQKLYSRVQDGTAKPKFSFVNPLYFNLSDTLSHCLLFYQITEI